MMRFSSLLSIYTSSFAVFKMNTAHGAILVLDLSTVMIFFKDVQYEHQKKGVTQYDLR